MNLVNDPWIPVLTKSGPEQVSLCDAFLRAEDLTDLDLSPTQRIAVTRLLICITQAALDGPRYDDFEACRDQIVERVIDYLADRCDRFNLFGERPFLQWPGMEPTFTGGKRCTIAGKIDLVAPCPSNKVLFDHDPLERSYTAGQAALCLLEAHTFYPPMITKGGATKAPPGSTNPLFCILRGPSLLDTIHWNLWVREVMEDSGGTFGVPAWDVPIEEIESSDLGTTYLGRLVPIARRVLLHEDLIHCDVERIGLEYERCPPIPDPMLTTKTRRDRKSGEDIPVDVRVDLTRSPWPNLASILLLGMRGGSATLPAALRGAPEGDLGYPVAFDLWLGGLVNDFASLTDRAEWSYHLSIDQHGSDGTFDLAKTAGLCQQCAEYAESCLYTKRGPCLNWAIQTYADEIGITTGSAQKTRAGLRDRAQQLYWSKLEAKFQDIVLGAGNSEEWQAYCRACAREVYNEVCVSESARHIRARALGFSKLPRQPKKST